MEHLKKFWTLYGTVIVSALTLFVPAVRTAIAEHPEVSTFVASAAAILAHLSPSPASNS